MGNTDIKTDNRTEGSRPVITPKITEGTFRMKLKNGRRWMREVMLEIEPTNATGIDQKMMRATTNEIVKTRRITLSHHLILRLLQMTSPGVIPVNRGLLRVSFGLDSLKRIAYAICRT